MTFKKKLTINFKPHWLTETSLLFLIILLCFFKFEIAYNEMDVIPYAKAVFNSDWLENDWYLNLNIPYRNLFSYPVGFFADTFGIVQTIIFGRLISYILVAFSLWFLMKSVKTTPYSFVHYLFIILFFKFFHFGLGAREWMVGGLETKVFAYSFAILSLSAFLRKRLRAGLLFAGLTLSFHLLVGIFNLFCLIPIFLFYQRESRSFRLDILKSLPIFLLAGGFGIYCILYQFFFLQEDMSSLGWNIYVNIRVPHHTLPNHFWPETWIKMIIFITLNVIFVLKSKSQKTKLTSAYAIFSALISLIGLTIFFTPVSNQYLKYYFFRFSDIMLPLIALLNVASFIIEKLKKFLPARKIQLKLLVIIISLLLLIPKIKYFIFEGKTNIRQIKAVTGDNSAMEYWVKKNTDRNKVFIAPPDASFFYINYDRPMFVSWKHCPQSGNDMVEWYNRLRLLNRGEEFHTLAQVKQSYYNLTEEDILVIAEDYSHIGYFITSSNKKLNFPILFKSGKYILYEVSNMVNKN